MTKLKEKQNVPEGWEIKNLESLTEQMKTGGTPLSSDKKLYGGEISFVKIDDMTTSGKFLSKTTTSISEEGLLKSSAWLVPKNSILYSIYATVGEVSVNKIEVATNQAIMGIVPNDNKVSRDYLYQYLVHIKPTLKKHFKETTQKNLTSKIVKDLEILLPKLKADQQKIAMILEAVDADIEETKSVIKATEKLKKGLMQKLFTRGIGHTKFKQTELGEVPESWRMEKLSDIAEVERGKFSHRPRNDSAFYGGDIPFIQTGDVVASFGRVNKFTQTLNEKGLQVSRLFKKGTIVMTIAANIGETAILEFDSCFPDSLVGITPRTTNPVFLEYYLRTCKKYLDSIATQSAQKNINLEKLSPLLVVVPELNEQEKIAEILMSIDEKIQVNKKLLAKQAELKKGLMQDLLSGVKRVNI